MATRPSPARPATARGAAASAPPAAVLFDAYGTLFDVYSVGLLAEQLWPGQGEAIARLWRDKQIEYTRLVAMSAPGGERYRPFWDLTRAALEWTLRRLGLDGRATRPDAAETLMAQYRHLSAFPEVHEVLRALKARGVVTGILSNGDPAMLGIAVRSAGLEDCLDHVISVEPARTFKTDPRAYALGPATLGLPAGRIAFVSSNGWDAWCAGWYGFRALWVNRTGLPPEALDPPPERQGATLREVLAFFPDSPAPATA